MSVTGSLSAFHMRVDLNCECAVPNGGNLVVGGEMTSPSTNNCAQSLSDCLGGTEQRTSERRQQRRTFVVSARAVRTTRDASVHVSPVSHLAEEGRVGNLGRDIHFVSVFVPPTIVESMTGGVHDMQLVDAEGMGTDIWGEEKEGVSTNDDKVASIHDDSSSQQIEEEESGNKSSSQPQHACRCITWKDDGIQEEQILSQIHPSLSGLILRGIVQTTSTCGVGRSTIDGTRCCTADILLLEIPICGDVPVVDLATLMDETNGEGMIGSPRSVIKCLPISKVSFTSSISSQTNLREAGGIVQSVDAGMPEIPSCPVCLHRIDPQRLGLPKPKNHHLCSQFCAVPAGTIPGVMPGEMGGSMTSCRNEEFLAPWPYPSYCTACHVIYEHWHGPSVASLGMAELQSDRLLGESGTQSTTPPSGAVPLGSGSGSVFASLDTATAAGSAKTLIAEEMNNANHGNRVCYKCGIRETLWVCLTCGLVGCGRYTFGHAREHNEESGHPYSLELATLRIWDYSASEFAHRGDLLKCPSVRRTGHLLGSGMGGHGLSAICSNEWISPAGTFKDDDNAQKGSSLDCQDEPPSCHPSVSNDNFPGMHYDDPSPKKATMIGQEYEALLQSALEDQAQHYEGEISRLRAALTAEEVDQEKMTEKEMMEIESLRTDISNLRSEVDRIGRLLLDAQAQEAGYRATSQRLLREQAVAQDLLDKIREETEREHELDRLQVEDLEQQVSDLTANLSMRNQISRDRELSNAQIFGTTGVSTKPPKRGKKLRRLFRK